MIECSDKNIWYNKKRKIRKKRIFAFIVILLVVLSAILYYKFFISQQIFAINKNFVKKYSIESVNSAVISSIDNEIRYEDLVYIEKNVQGDIVLMNANSYKMNQVSRLIEKETVDYIDDKLAKGTPIPALAFSGIGAISGYGSPIYLKTATVSNVWCDFESEFTSVGINQTLHSIYVNVNINVAINVPFNNGNENYNSRILLSETVLVGKVPEIYLNGKIFG